MNEEGGVGGAKTTAKTTGNGTTIYAAIVRGQTLSIEAFEIPAGKNPGTVVREFLGWKGPYGRIAAIFDRNGLRALEESIGNLLSGPIPGLDLAIEVEPTRKTA
jgi:hypothetical protein